MRPVDEVFPLPGRPTEAQALLAGSVARWADREVLSVGAAQHAASETERFAGPLARLGELLDLPGGVDGLLEAEPGAAAATVAAVLEQVGRADPGIGLALAGTVSVRQAVRPSLSREAWEALFAADSPLPLAAPVLPGYGQQALPTSERPAAFHGLEAQASVVAEGADGWRLRAAAARPPCAGGGAALYGVIATVAGRAEPALVLVPRGAAGLGVGAPLRQTGLEGPGANADVALDGVAVPADHVLVGPEPWHRLLAWQQLGLAAVCSGAGLSAWAILDDWAESRVIKGRGQPFKANSLTGAVMGQIGGRLGVVRLLVGQLAALLDDDDGLDDDGSDVERAAPLPAARVAATTGVCQAVGHEVCEVLDRAMELMGSAGYATEWQLERYWRGVKAAVAGLRPQVVARAELAAHCFGCDPRSGGGGAR